jgi:hypothetical protein
LVASHDRVVILVVGLRRARHHTPRTASLSKGGHAE